MGGKCLLHPVLVPFRESWPTPFQCCGQLSHFRRASFRDLQGKENADVHLRIAFLVVATFLNPIQIGSGATTSSRVPIHFLQVWRDH